MNKNSYEISVYKSVVFDLQRPESYSYVVSVWHVLSYDSLLKVRKATELRFLGYCLYPTEWLFQSLSYTFTVIEPYLCVNC